MGGLFGGGGSQGSTPSAIRNFKLQSSAYGNVIQIQYGRGRIAGQYLWAGDFASHKNTVGGKGGNHGSTFYTYTISTQIGLSRGPIAGVGRLWRMGNGLERESAAHVAGAWTIETGNLGQSPWVYLSNNHPGSDLGYTGVAWAARPHEQLGTGATPPQRTWEVFGLLCWQPAGPIYDADPKNIVLDMLTNPFYGTGFPIAWVDKDGSFIDFSLYCIANNIFLSPLMDQQKPVADWIGGAGDAKTGGSGGILEIANADMVFSSGVLKIIPYGDTSATAHGVTWNPALTAIYNLTDDSFLTPKSNEDPMVVTQENPIDRYNIEKVEFINAANDYNIEVVDIRDESEIMINRERRNQPRAYHPITNAALATFIGRLKLQRNLWTQNKYEFTLSAQYFLLDPMDIVDINDSALNLFQYPVRIVSIEEDENYDLKVVAEDIGPNFSPGYPSQPPNPYGFVDSNIQPQSVNPPFFMEPMLPAGHYELWIGISGENGSGQTGNPDWAGVNAWYSEDNVNFSIVGQQRAPAVQGYLFNSLPAGSSVDTVNTLSADASECGGTIGPYGILLPGIGGANGIIVDYGGESLTYQNVSPGPLPFQFNLTNLYRGQNNTQISAHANGAPFLFYGDLAFPHPGIFRFSYRPATVGSTVYFKFTSVNTMINAPEDLADVQVWPHTIQGLTQVNNQQQTNLRQPSTAYSLGNIVQGVTAVNLPGFGSNPVIGNGYLYKCVVATGAGTTSAANPPTGVDAFNTCITVGQALVDGLVTWQCIGPLT